jgi:hypothetical protein
MIGRMPTIYYGNESRIVQVAGYGVKVIINADGNWYYSIQDMLDAMGEDFKRKVYDRLVDYGAEEHLIRAPGAKFYYGDIRAVELLASIVGTERAKEVWGKLNPNQ